MEGAAVVSATRGGSLPMSSSPRQEWRAVSDHHRSGRNVGDEELERSKLGQSDERTIYEHGREPADVDFCSIPMDGGLDNDIIEQRLSSVSRKREELQHLEIELRAQAIARPEIIEMQHSFDAQAKEHANTVSQLQEQLHVRDQRLHELERKIEEQDRELNQIKLEKEAAWAKEDLLREQNKELATFRRERDLSEAERAQHLKQIHDLQEHIQERDRQLNDLQEQCRNAQETIVYKDEQFREAQSYIARVQEMDVLQSHSLQAELRERTEQYNQLWLVCQRQFTELERFHLHTIQQLQLELADARERSSTHADESCNAQTKLKDGSQFTQNSGNQEDSNGDVKNANGGVLPNGTSDNVQHFPPGSNASAQGVSFGQSSILGMHAYVQPEQVTALHSLFMHQQGVPHSMPSHVPQSQVGPFHPMASISSMQQWQNQQQTVVADNSQYSVHSQLPASPNDQNLMSADGKYGYEIHVNGEAIESEYPDQVSQQPEPSSAITSTVKQQDRVSVNSTYLAQLEQSTQQISAASVSPPDTSEHSFDVSETAVNNGTSSVLPDALVSVRSVDTGVAAQTTEVAFFDERSLLACIVRTIPAGGSIRISSTLPNRLGKMLSPLHWHDYKKKYGKLDDFVASHPELFVIEGDYIQLRDGAQARIAATAAAAKVAEAAAAIAPHATIFPSVAVTPMAQPNPVRKQPSVESNSYDFPEPSVRPNPHRNGVRCSVASGHSNVKILNKPKVSELNGANFDRSSVTSAESKGSTRGSSNAGFVGKQQGRASRAVNTSRR